MAAETPLDSGGSTERPIGNENQLELLERLRSRHPRLGQTYEGALRAFANPANPECLVHAAHSMRELFDALTVAAQIERKHTANLKDKVDKTSRDWFAAVKRSTALTQTGWDGPIDIVLRKLLLQLGEFFNWFQEEHPRHAAERDLALDRLDPGRGQLPEQLRKQRGQTQNELAVYMNLVAHHSIESSEAEFATKLAEAESFLKSFITPTPLADGKTMDEILKGEA